MVAIAESFRGTWEREVERWEVAELELLARRLLDWTMTRARV